MVLVLSGMQIGHGARHWCTGSAVCCVYSSSMHHWTQTEAQGAQGAGKNGGCIAEQSLTAIMKRWGQSLRSSICLEKQESRLVCRVCCPGSMSLEMASMPRATAFADGLGPFAGSGLHLACDSLFCWYSEHPANSACTSTPSGSPLCMSNDASGGPAHAFMSCMV